MRLPAAVQHATSLAGRAARRLEEARQAPVLALLLVVQWLAVLGLALTVRHAGWTWYQGGDQLWYYTSGWLLAHGHLPYAGVGYLWSVLLAPFSLVLGPNVQDAYPAVVLLDVLVLLPVALLALYGIGRRVGGRVFGYWACAVWIALPFVGILYVNAGYHRIYVEQFLPQALGLTALADFPALVAVLVSSYFCLRTILDERPQAVHALAAGLAAGAAIGMKPSAAIFLGGPALAYFDARRPREALRFGVALLPALVTMALWKLRSSGHIPLLSSAPYDAVRVAAGATVLPLGVNLHRYLNLDWAHLGDELANLRRYFAVGRLVEWGSVAGVFALGRRSAGAAVLAAGWLGSFVVVKGTWDDATLKTGSLLRIMIPAFPAFVLLIAALPLLWPGLARRLPAPAPAGAPAVARRTAVLLVAGLLLTAVVPLVAIAAATPGSAAAPYEAEPPGGAPTPAGITLGLHADVSGGVVTLGWRPQSSAGGPLFYHVYRGRSSVGDFACNGGSGAQRCQLTMQDLGTTRAATFSDRPGKGVWRYRVGVAANWLDDPTLGDVYVVSSAVSATVAG